MPLPTVFRSKLRRAGASGNARGWTPDASQFAVLLRRESSSIAAQILLAVAAAIACVTWGFISNWLAAVQQPSAFHVWALPLVIAAALLITQRLQDKIRHACYKAATKTYLQQLPAKGGKDSSSASLADDAEWADDGDDVCVQKAAAQARTAGQAAAVTHSVQQLQAALSGRRDPASAAGQLAQLARLGFESEATSQLMVEQGALPCLLVGMEEAAAGATGCQAEQQLLLQASWVLLQVAHQAQLAAQHLSTRAVFVMLHRVLCEVCRAQDPVVVNDDAAAAAVSAAVRNITWTCYLLSRCSGEVSSSSEECTRAGRLDAVGANPSGQQFPSPATTSTSWLGVHGSRPASAAAASATAAANCLLLHQTGLLGQLQQQLLPLQWGPLPAILAAATLGQCLLVDPAMTSTSAEEVCALQEAAGAALCSCDGSRVVLLSLLQQQQQLDPGLSRSLQQMLLALCRRWPLQLLRSLTEQQLVGSFLQVLPPPLGKHLVCHLLSNPGQQQLLQLERDGTLDVAVTLAQVLALPVHQLLPPQQVGGQSSPQAVQHPEIEAQPDSEAAAFMEHYGGAAGHGELSCSSELVSTWVLACRLLLQGQRLPELLLGYAAKLLQLGPAAAQLALESGAQQQQDEQGQNAANLFPASNVYDPGAAVTACEQASTASEGVGASTSTTAAADVINPAQQLSGAAPFPPNSGMAGSADVMAPGPIAAVELLLAFLAKQPLQLQEASAVQGSGFADSSCSSCSTSTSALQVVGSMTGSVEAASAPKPQQAAAITQPGCVADASAGAAQGGAWEVVGAGAVPGADGTAGTAEGGVGPAAEAVAPTTRASGCEHEDDASSSGSANGAGTNSNNQSRQVPLSAVQELRRTSPLLHFLLRDVATQLVHQGSSMLTFPHLGPAVDGFAVQQLLEWSGTQQLPPQLSAAQLVQLWVASDILQVDGLKRCCEDRLAASFAVDLGFVAAALRLCSTHRHSSTRLQTLLVRALVSGTATWLPKTQLRAWMVQHTALLVPGLVREVRDALTAACLLMEDVQ